MAQFLPTFDKIKNSADDEIKFRYDVDHIKDLVLSPWYQQYHINFFFLVDRSDSMGEDGGQKMITTKKALKLFLMSLPSDSSFSIITYGKKYEWLGGKKQAFKKTDENLKFALEEIKKI